MRSFAAGDGARRLSDAAIHVTTDALRSCLGVGVARALGEDLAADASTTNEDWPGEARVDGAWSRETVRAAEGRSAVRLERAHAARPRARAQTSDLDVSSGDNGCPVVVAEVDFATAAWGQVWNGW